MTGLDPTTVISTLGLTLLGVAGLIGLLPVGTCPHCSHCKLEKMARERERETQPGRVRPAPFCMVCGRYHGADEDHER